MRKNKKGYLQISFAWLFAIIVGAFILFLAIFFAAKLLGTEQTLQNAKTSKEIGILLNPLETSFETGKTLSLSFPIETRIYNKCNLQGNFGKQLIQVSQKNFNKWSETDIDVGFSNKYIFSGQYSEGKNFYLFSKPFVFPFKVSDLIYIIPSSEEYCFKNAPEEIQSEIRLLGKENLLIGNCSQNSINVCFDSGSECDIKIDYNLGYVLKGGKRIYFQEDALMYAAIFSDSDIYECQIKRLMQRINELALLYNEKEAFISERGCDAELNLLTLSSVSKKLDNSAGLAAVAVVADDIKDKNEVANCRLW